MSGLVTIVSVKGYGRAALGGGTSTVIKKGGGPGNAAGGVGIRYRYGKYDYCPASTEGRRVARVIGGRVAGGAAASNGEGGISVSKEVAPHILRNPARTVLRPSASAVN